MEIARREKPDLVLVDLRLEQPRSHTSRIATDPRGNGYGLVRALRSEHPDVRIVMISGGRAWAFSVEARKAGANGMLCREYGPWRVITIIEGERLRDHDREATMPTLDRMSHEYIAKVFESTGRNIMRTAQLLGIDRNTLRRKLQENVNTTFDDPELDDALDDGES